MSRQEALPKTDLTLDDARSKLAGWHFAQEALSDGERRILYVAEALLRRLDERDEEIQAANADRLEEGEVALRYRVVIDKEALDAYCRGLYGGPPDDPVIGEPEPGIQLMTDWLKEARGSVADKNWHVDTVMWSERYVKRVELAVETHDGQEAV